MTTNTTAKRKLKLPLPVLLTYLIVVTLVATGVSLSAYVTTASGEDEARVAKFEVNVTDKNEHVVLTESFNAKLKPGDTEGVFLVKNKSEVSIEYTAEIKNTTNNLPIEVSTGTGSNVLAPGATSEGQVIIKWTEDATSTAYMGKVDLIEITVTAAQVD